MNKSATKLKTKQKPSVNIKECMACRLCISSCPFGCLEDSLVGVDKYNKSYPALVQPEECTGCKLCVTACPVEAIEMVSPSG